MSSSSPPPSKKQKSGKQNRGDPQYLSPSLIARILSYNVESTMDLALLRRVHPQVNASLVATVVDARPDTATGAGSHSSVVKKGPALKIPNRVPYDESLLQYMHHLSHQKDWATTAGNAFEIVRDHVGANIFPGATVKHILPVEQLTSVPPFALRDTSLAGKTNHETYQMLDSVYHEFANVWNRVDVGTSSFQIATRGEERVARRFDGDDDDERVVVRYLLSLHVPVDAPCTHKVVYQHEEERYNNDLVGLVQLRTNAGPTSDEEEDEQDYPMRPLEHNCVYTAFFFSFEPGTHREENDMSGADGSDLEDDDEDNTDGGEPHFKAFVLVDLVCKNEYLECNATLEWASNRYLPLSLAWNIAFNSPKVEGVAIVDRILTSEASLALNQQINDLARVQEQAGLIDYHPRSKNIVRDILHPALYAYVKGQSPLRKQVDDIAPCLLPNTQKVKQVAGKDTWGRTHETSSYQWLPTYFSISSSGKCTIEDYINNLTPRHDPVHEALYAGLENLFEFCLPFIESVYGYALQAQRKVQGGNEHDDEEEEEGGDRPYRFQLPTCDPLEMKPCSLRGQKLQVITKIVDYELNPGQSHSGVWHVEGMSHEEIVLTALYIADRDESVDGAALLFKRAFFDDETRLTYFAVPQLRPPAVDRALHDSVIPLGTVETPKGRLIVFPNSHVHKVEDMTNGDVDFDDSSDDEETEEAKGPTKAKRRIVVFFLVNPLRRIVSTREVAAQQGSQGGWLNLDDARAHRLQLMEERRVHKQDWNVREIHLCEH